MSTDAGILRMQVIARANNTSYGLAAGVVTSNLNTANTLSRALKAGTIWVSPIPKHAR